MDERWQLAGFKARAWFRRLLLDSWIARWVRHPVLEILVPAIVGLYLGTLDIWGGEWSLIKDHKGFHEVAYVLLVFGILFAVMFRGLGDLVTRKQYSASYASVLESLLVSVGKIISAKADRFQLKMGGINSKTNVFNEITKPSEQIKVILAEAKAFMMSTIPSVSEEAFDITVVWSSGKKWTSLGKAQPNWQHTDPAVLAEDVNSTIYECVTTGEVVFHPDKESAANSGKYVLSERDEKHGKNGSILCIPLILEETPDHAIFPRRRDICVVTFCTYGVPICAVGDTDTAKAVKFLCGEFAQRIRIEFILHTLRERKTLLNREAQKSRKKRK